VATLGISPIEIDSRVVIISHMPDVNCTSRDTFETRPGVVSDKGGLSPLDGLEVTKCVATHLVALPRSGVSHSGDADGYLNSRANIVGFDAPMIEDKSVLLNDSYGNVTVGFDTFREGAVSGLIHVGGQRSAVEHQGDGPMLKD